MYYFDNGDYFDGDIYDVIVGMYKWVLDDSKLLIMDVVKVGEIYVFICVCNFYMWIFSLFFDKICGI